MRRTARIALLAVLLAAIAAPAHAAPEATSRITSTSGIPHRDVADVTTSPRWKPGMPAGYTDAWDRYLTTVAGQVTASNPDVVLHQGDMVEGRWTGYAHPGEGWVFGAADRMWQKRRAVNTAADVYYPWLRRYLERRTPEVLWGIGDHEIGDMGSVGYVPASQARAKLLEDYRSAWTRHLGKWGNSRYAVLRGNVGILTLDPFVAWPRGTVAHIDRGQRAWMRRKIGNLRHRGADWIIVQCETPAVGPNNLTSSSGLTLRGGRKLMGDMDRWGVDLFLTSEFHDDTVHTVGGRAPVQVVHGGRETRASWLDITVRGARRLDLQLWESVGAAEGSGRVWAMSNARANDGPVAGMPSRTGTATLWQAGGLTRRTGRLAVEGLR